MVQHPETANGKDSVNKVFLKNCKIHKKAILESLFNKVAGPEACFLWVLQKCFYRTAPVAATDYSGLFYIKLERHIFCQGELPRLYTNLANLYFLINWTSFVPKSHYRVVEFSF